MSPIDEKNVILVQNNINPLTFEHRDNIVLVSELPLSYLQGIRDAENLDAILIGSNGRELQMSKNVVPEYTNVDSIEKALEIVESR